MTFFENVAKSEWYVVPSIINKSDQPSVKSSFGPKLTKAEQDQFEIELGIWFFMTGTPVYRIQNKQMQKALRILRPDVTKRSPPLMTI